VRRQPSRLSKARTPKFAVRGTPVAHGAPFPAVYKSSACAGSVSAFSPNRGDCRASQVLCDIRAAHSGRHHQKPRLTVTQQLRTVRGRNRSQF